MQNRKKVVIFIGDLLALAASFFISLRLGYLSSFYISIYKTHLGPFLIIYGIWIIIIFAFGLYHPGNIRPSFKNTKNIFTAFAVSFLLSLSVFYLFPIFGISPKTNLMINMAMFIIFFIAERRLITLIFLKKFQEKILLVGHGDELHGLENHIKENIHGFYRIEDKVEILGETAVEAITTGIYDLVIFSEKDIDEHSITKNIEGIVNSKARFWDIRHAYEKILTKVYSKGINELWFATNVFTFRSHLYESTKRLIEIIISGIVLVIISPLLLIACIAIKINDGGPFVYSHERVGKGGVLFTIYKIRSMIQNSEVNGPEWSRTNDERVTKIGKILRATHLDESLQLINIIRGDLSLVGPRPERPKFVHELSEKIKNYNLRHIVKPGLTGWAQVYYKYGNSVEDARQKFEYDLYYIKHSSILMDFGIIIRTLQKLFI